MTDDPKKPGEVLRRDPGNTDIDKLVAPLDPDDDVFTLIFTSPPMDDTEDRDGD